MSRYSHNKGRSKDTFMMLEYYIMDSAAYLSLSPNARSLLNMMIKRHNGHNNGEIAFSCREAATLCNFGKNTGSQTFKELQDKGFIRMTQNSGFNVKRRLSRRWLLTFKSAYGKPATHDWKKYTPKEKK